MDPSLKLKSLDLILTGHLHLKQHTNADAFVCFLMQCWFWSEHLVINKNVISVHLN